MLLAGDIGGTKTVLALFSEALGPRQPLVEKTFPSDGYHSLLAVINAFLAGRPDGTLTGAAFGIAGPVINNRVRTTNLPWTIEAEELAEHLNLPGRVYLLNDLEATATGVPTLLPDEVATLQAGEPEPTAAIAVVAPGTGLGEAYLTWDGQRYRAHPSEGGHAGFGPETDTEFELLAYLRGRFDHVSFERVCSGIGIPNLYAFWRDSGRYEEPGWLRQALEAAEDRVPIIAQAALEGKAEICTATMNLFVEILGNEAGNMALKTGALGGVYLGGGIPPRILPLLQGPHFVAAFKRKGRFAALLGRVPVHVILNRHLALSGAARYGLEVA